MTILRTAFDLLDGLDDAASSAEIGRRFFARLKPMGFNSIFVRTHTLDPRDAREHIYYQERPAAFEQIYGARNFAAANFVTRAARKRTTPFRWRNLPVPHNEADANAERDIWGVLSSFGVADGIALANHKLSSVTVLSLAIQHGTDLSPERAKAITLAGQFVHERIDELERAPFPPVTLTPRERDCLAFAAEGKSDWDISLILGVAQSTVHTHVESAKRKLGVKTRLQAYARLARAGEL